MGPKSLFETFSFHSPLKLGLDCAMSAGTASMAMIISAAIPILVRIPQSIPHPLPGGKCRVTRLHTAERGSKNESSERYSAKAMHSAGVALPTLIHGLGTTINLPPNHLGHFLSTDQGPPVFVDGGGGEWVQ
jgi:hypothetical protein